MLQATDPPEELARGARRMRSEPIMMPTLAKAPTHDVGVPVGGAALEIPEKGCRFLRFASCDPNTEQYPSRCSRRVPLPASRDADPDDYAAWVLLGYFIVSVSRDLVFLHSAIWDSLEIEVLFFSFRNSRRKRKKADH